jgi:L-ascorbate metabolism protein UlaG (beta-lactamase superfamily)
MNDIRVFGGPTTLIKFGGLRFLTDPTFDPPGCEPFTGDGLPTTYVGDNDSLELVREIAERFGPVDTAVFFAGAARVGLMDNARLTRDSAQAVEAARILGARRVVPVHCDSWAHFTEGREVLGKAFEAAGLADRLSCG